MIEFSDYIGRKETSRDYSDSGQMRRFASTLDHVSPPWAPSVVPPLGHWLFFKPDERGSDVGLDGHPIRRADGLIPPVDLPRRMWAGSRIRFLDNLPLDAPVSRTSTLIAATPKAGRSGRLLLVTLRHEIGVSDRSAAIIEEQDLVYREVADVSSPFHRAGSAKGEDDPIVRWIKPDPVMLFRYSALTFNSHRIHYDRDFASSYEGYPSLVIHGPLLASLLMDHLLREIGPKPITSYKFRAESPLLEGDMVQLGLRLEGQQAFLRAVGPAVVGMTAVAEIGG